jgi:hypothetical protein
MTNLPVLSVLSVGLGGGFCFMVLVLVLVNFGKEEADCCRNLLYQIRSRDHFSGAVVGALSKGLCFERRLDAEGGKKYGMHPHGRWWTWGRGLLAGVQCLPVASGERFAFDRRTVARSGHSVLGCLTVQMK